MSEWYPKGTPSASALIQRLPKDCRDLGARALDQGFAVRDGKGHIVFRGTKPESPLVRVATTPSDWRSARNFRRDLVGAGFKTDLTDEIAAAAEEKRERQRIEQDKEARTMQRLDREGQLRAENEAREEARKHARELTEQTRQHVKEAEYARLWEHMRPWARTLAALDKEGGEIHGGYEALFQAVYGEPMGDKASRVQMLVKSLESEKGYVQRLYSGSNVVAFAITEEGQKALSDAVAQARARTQEPPVITDLTAFTEELRAHKSPFGDQVADVLGGDVTNVMRVIEALVEKLLDALGFEAIVLERDELRRKVEHLESKPLTLPKTGRLSDREVAAAESVVMSLRAR